ncbi:unnamed protein product, partial [Mesorhabditis spiculigera]
MGGSPKDWDKMIGQMERQRMAYAAQCNGAPDRLKKQCFLLVSLLGQLVQKVKQFKDVTERFESLKLQ